MPPTFTRRFGGAATVARTTATRTTASITNNATDQGTITLAKSYRLLKITTTKACRVRLYDRAAKQTTDLSRNVNTKPTGDSGVMLDYVTTTAVLSALFSPQVVGSDNETVPVTAIPITVTNLSGSTSTLTVTLQYVAME